MANTEENYASQPRWVRERRYGIHGVDHMETGRFDGDPVPSFPDLFRRYSEAVFTIDENVGRVLQHLEKSGAAANTVIVYMGDNGFALGEHGFYDKRDAYETSIRVPLVAWAPGRIKSGTVVTQLVQNIDVAPTFLEAAGVPQPPQTPKMDGASFWPLLQGRRVPWRDRILYEYHWEWNFPATPTLFALRTERWKYIYHHGVWDLDALYDLQTDPIERHNLIQVPAFREQAESLRTQLFDALERSGALQVSLPRPAGEPLHDRKLPR
jgi:N-acetylglucosamine-6-sulfatase